MNEILNTPPSADGYLDKRGLAARLLLTPRTVDRLMARGLPHFKLGARRVRFKAAEVDAFLASKFRVSRITPAKTSQPSRANRRRRA